MTATDSVTGGTPGAPSFQFVLIALVALTAIRIAGLHASVVDLYVDEAQYWLWSRDLQLGYFSKPPLLAWLIAATNLVCGSGEACVRITAPLLYFGMCLLVYAVADELYGREAAAWASLASALGTGLTFSSRIMSTDVPLMFCWAAALLAYVKLLRDPDWRWAVTLGLSIGFGLLSKYAMAYFVLCALLAAPLQRATQELLLRRQTWIALAIALLVAAPNVYWNLENDFATLRHTSDNVTGAGLRFKPSDALAFVGSQFAVAGPLIFGAFLVILGLHGPRSHPNDRLMLAFSLPPLVLVTALSFLRNAHPNWAAPALLSMTILVVAWWLRNNHRRWLWATLAIGLAMQVVLIAGDANAYRVALPALGTKADLYQRTLGWREFGSQASRMARQAGTPVVVAEGTGGRRAEVAALRYYLRDEPITALTWQIRATPRHYFETELSLDDSVSGPVLFITYCPSPARLQPFYQNITSLGSFDVRSGPTSTRRYYAYRLESRIRPIEPIDACG